MMVLNTADKLHAAKYAYAFYCELAQQDDAHIADIFTCCRCVDAYKDDAGEREDMEYVTQALSSRFAHLIWSSPALVQEHNPLGFIIRQEFPRAMMCGATGIAHYYHDYFHRLVELRRFYIAWVIQHLEVILGYEN